MMNKSNCKKGECKPSVPTSKNKPRKSACGKGDAPRNLSKKFRDNYESINWSKKSE